MNGGVGVYHFEDGGGPLVVGRGVAFVLPASPRHRGAKRVPPARLFLIDAIPAA